MTYEAWRISYQSSEQAARAAYAECVQSQAKVEATEKERDALRAELDALKTWKAEVEARVAGEQPAPSAPVGLITDYFVSISDHVAHQEEPKTQAETGDLLRMLAAIPCAQPAPSAPGDWLPVPEKHPTFDPVDLQLSDGSVLCGCVPQSDCDYWWEGPSGEVFIDPKYANVTHWRLAAAPETKP